MRLNSPQINIITRACMKASKSLIRDFGEIENLQVSTKGPGDFVTSADRRTEKILIEELQKAHPDYGIITEESGIINKSNSKNRWIIDPIDGTMNFLNGIPQFAISIGYERFNQFLIGGYEMDCHFRENDLDQNLPVILALIGALVIPQVIPIFFPDFNESTELIPLMSLAIIPSTISGLYNSKFLAREKSNYVVVANITSMLVLIIGIFTLGQSLGVVGLAYSFFISALSRAVFYFCLNKKI